VGPRGRVTAAAVVHGIFQCAHDIPFATCYTPPMISIGITDHLEGPRERPSAEIFDEVSDLARLADELGIDYFWFAEHHAHAHHGHLPAPLLFALHLAGQTKRIRLGTAIICLNLHHPLAIAEQVATADLLCGNRLAPGFGSGSTPEEFALFSLPETDEAERHERFAEALRIIREAWAGRVMHGATRYFQVPPHDFLPIPAPDLARRSWLAANSQAAARIAGAIGFNMLFSHLRTPDQYRDYAQLYRRARGAGLIAANRPVYVGRDDRTAFAEAEPALRILWRRFQIEGKIPTEMLEPSDVRDLCAHPLNFLVGGPPSVARQLLELHAQVPFDVANLEVRWPGLSHEQVRESLRRLATDVGPLAASHLPQGLTSEK
jgi:alkanesulfonate monooxygenase SsuD/methylene tetrahydromethanopterin reductase-like flavin-dependent oxidoreductase (luciferase family)